MEHTDGQTSVPADIIDNSHLKFCGPINILSTTYRADCDQYAEISLASSLASLRSRHPQSAMRTPPGVAPGATTPNEEQQGHPQGLEGENAGNKPKAQDRPRFLFTGILAILYSL